MCLSLLARHLLSISLVLSMYMTRPLVLVVIRIQLVLHRRRCLILRRNLICRISVRMIARMMCIMFRVISIRASSSESY